MSEQLNMKHIEANSNISILLKFCVMDVSPIECEFWVDFNCVDETNQALDTWYPSIIAYQLVCCFFFQNWYPYPYWKLAFTNLCMVESRLWCEHEILFIPFWHLKSLEPAILVPNPKPNYVFTRGINIA